MKDRLTKIDWIKHGLRTLADNGANALKVRPMSTKLGVSRGSFYWHFQDIADFRLQILQSWQERTTERVIQEIDAEAEPDRLRQLLKRAFAGGHGLGLAWDDEWSAERAIRSWAAEDADVAVLVASVDASRVAYIARLLVAAGLDAPRSLSRATFMYWAYLGRSFVMDSHHSSITGPALDDIGDLFSR